MSARDAVVRLLVGVAVCLLRSATIFGAEPPLSPAPQETSVPTVHDHMTVQLNYTLTVEGNVVDTTQGHEPLSYVHGRGQLIPGLERQLVGLKSGERRTLTVSPEEGYGPVDPSAVVSVPRSQLSADITPEVGLVLRGTQPDGRSFRATVREVGADNVSLDLNHPLAGKTLQFDVSVVSVTPATPS